MIINDKEKSLGLGDRMEQALTSVGITKERVEAWLGEPCRCPERKEKLNQLGRWLRRVTSGKIEHAQKYLLEILSQD